MVTTRLVAGLVLAVASGAAVGVGPVTAAAGTDTSFTYTSEPGDYIGQGGSGSFSDPATFSLTGTAASVNVHVYTGSHWWDVRLAAPPGRLLTTGVYEDARRAGFTAAPGLDVSTDSRGCNALTGRFTVYAISADAEGRVTALDAGFTQYCEGLTPALRGTVHYAAPVATTSAPLVTSSSPTSVTGQPVTLTARTAPGSGAGGVVFYDGGTAVGQGSVDAAGTARLTTATLAAGSHSITARVGTSTSPAITQVVRDGGSSLWMTSGFLEYVGGGGEATYVPSSASLTFAGTTNSAYLGVESPVSGDYWRVSIAAPPGEPLEVGTYTGVVRRGFEAAGQPGLELTGDGRGCSSLRGEFTVSQVTKSTTGVVTGVDVALVQYCDSNPYPLRARLRWNATATTTQPTASSTTLSATASGPLEATLTATVTGGAAVATGVVTFTEGGTTLGSASLDPQGRAVVTASLARGPHTVTASYGGSPTLLPSSAQSRVTLVGLSSSTVVTVPRSAKLGRATSVGVAVTGSDSATPTGTVRLYDGVEPVGTAATLVGGRATISWTPTAKGKRSLSVRYTGDERYAPSTSASSTVKVT